MRLNEPDSVAISLAARRLLDACWVTEPYTDLSKLAHHLGLTVASLDDQVVGTDVDGTPKVKALLDCASQLVLLHPSLSDRPRRWALAHELGHYSLESHRSLLHACSQFDLDSATQHYMEAEANLFASELLFQGEGFSTDCHDLPISAQTVRLAADRYLVSYEAAFIQYVLRHRRPCALVVLPTASTDRPYALRSRQFWMRTPREDELREAIRAGSDSVDVDSSDDPSLATLHLDAFDNSYKTFVLLRPVKLTAGAFTYTLTTTQSHGIELED